MKPDDYYNQLGTELKSIEDQIRELKKRQPNGTDTVLTYANQNVAWDIDWTPTWSFTPGSSRSLNKAVIFDADEQDAPISSMRYEILVNNTYWYTIGSFDAPFMGLVAVNGYVHDYFLSYAGLVPTPKKDGWYFNVSAYASGTNIKVRFIIDSTDTGTITVQDTAF
jgi:hypothetical protein